MELHVLCSILLHRDVLVREPDGHGRGRVGFSKLDPGSALIEPDLVHVEDDVLRSSFTPEDARIVGVVSEDETLDAVRQIVKFLHASLVRRLVYWSP